MKAAGLRRIGADDRLPHAPLASVTRRDDGAASDVDAARVRPRSRRDVSATRRGRRGSPRSRPASRIEREQAVIEERGRRGGRESPPRGERRGRRRRAGARATRADSAEAACGSPLSPAVSSAAGDGRARAADPLVVRQSGDEKRSRTMSIGRVEGSSRRMPAAAARSARLTGIDMLPKAPSALRARRRGDEQQQNAGRRSGCRSAYARHSSGVGGALQDLARRILPGAAGEAVARVRARAAQVQARQRRAVVGPAQRRTHREELIERQLAVVDVAARQPVDLSRSSGVITWPCSTRPVTPGA